MTSSREAPRETATNESTVIVAMSVRETVAEARLHALATSVDGSMAHLQFGEPTLANHLTRLADDGVTHITLVGVSLGNLAPAVSWLRRIAAHWWRDRSGPRPVIEVATRLVADADDLPGILAETKPIGGDEPGLTSAAWADVPDHRHQLLVCRGPRCTAMGSDRTAEAFVLALMARGLGDDDVLITHTGCLFPCNHAPLVAVQPDDVWYGGVDAEAAEQIVAQHLVAGSPVEDLRLPRRRVDR